MNRRDIVSTIIVILAGAFWAFGKYAQWYVLDTGIFDYGVFLDTAYNIIHYHTFFNYPEFFLHGATSHLQVHFQPIIIVYAFFLWVTGKPWILGVIDVVNWTIAGLMIVWIAKREGRDPLFWATMWVINPITNAIFFDAHPISFAFPFGVLATYGAIKKNWKMLAIGTAGLFLVKEDAGLILVAAGIYLLGDYVDEILYEPIGTVKKIIQEKHYGLKVALLGLLLIAVTNGLIDLMGRKWSLEVYNTGVMMVFTSVGMVYFFSDLFLSGVFFIKRHASSFFLAIMVFITESFISNRPTQILYTFHYYTYFAAFFMVILIVEGVKRKKTYLAITFIVFLLLSPVTVLVTRTPFSNYGGLGKDRLGLLQIEYMYLKNREATVYLSKEIHLKTEEEIEKNGYACLGPHVYQYAIGIDPKRVYPAFLAFERERKMFPVCKSALVIVNDNACIGNCVPVAKNIKAVASVTQVRIKRT